MKPWRSFCRLGPAAWGSRLSVQPKARVPPQLSRVRLNRRAGAQTTVESERQEAERQARKILDDEAIVAVEETREALQHIADGKTREAREAIERAQGKLDLLLTRNPASALLPVDLRSQGHRHCAER